MKKLLLIALSFCIFSEIASAQNTSKNQTPDKGLSEYDKKKLQWDRMFEVTWDGFDFKIERKTN